MPTGSADVLAITGLTRLSRWNVAAPLGMPVVVTYGFPQEKQAYDPTDAPGFVGFSAAHQHS